MTIKKEYEIGDSAWVYGITRRNNRLVKGKIIAKINLPEFTGIHYIISIPTEIEPLLEIRTWESISQDEIGPLGMYRDITRTMHSTTKFLSKCGFTEAEEMEDLLDPTEEEIRAALEKSLDNNNHPPLILKESKQKTRKRFNRKRI